MTNQTTYATQQLVCEYDAQLAINVRTGGAPWDVDGLFLVLERLGFTRDTDGRAIMFDDDGTALFSLSTDATASTATRLTLLLDVPVVKPDKDAFGKMMDCARKLAVQLGGMAVDDAGQPLSDASIATIERQVTAFHADMEAAGIPAGSPSALHLFARLPSFQSASRGC